MGEFHKLRNAEAVAGRMQKISNSIRSGRDQLVADEVRIDFLRARILAALQRTHAFEERFFERPPDGHHFSDRLHLRPQRRIRPGKFLKGPFRNFHDDVIEHGFEGGGSLLRNVVWNLIERIADGEFRGDFRDGKPCCL